MTEKSKVNIKQIKEIEPSIANFTNAYQLSKRESDVFNLLVHQVVTAEDIANQLSISGNTVRIPVSYTHLTLPTTPYV